MSVFKGFTRFFLIQELDLSVFTVKVLQGIGTFLGSGKLVFKDQDRFSEFRMEILVFRLGFQRIGTVLRVNLAFQDLDCGALRSMGFQRIDFNGAFKGFGQFLGSGLGYFFD